MNVLRAATRGLLRQSVVHPFRVRPIPSTSRLAHTPAPGTGRNKKKGSNLQARNEQIPYRVVRVVDSETSRLGDEWVALSDILATIKRKEYYVELVAEYPEPVVKVIKSSVVYNKMRARAERQKVKREEKEVQMSWAISSADLTRKLEKVRKELEAGNRVDLVYTPKSGQPKPTPAQVKNQAAEMVKALEDVGEEWQPRTSTKTTLVMHFQGHNEPSASKDAGSSHKARWEEKKKKKIERREKELLRQNRYPKQPQLPTSSAS
ncbi:uncharacterized protein C8Q71DRAFT_13066 [Rhodofomes roseus]|uniref:Translation initiation factor 3 N-terminal domain-containing protein n=1 Tax=Rhodofomes roseus TaxID=34475 RepID=A0ABQ8KWV0_9APHY|nr:uncharacterized protein C8Q71DRAFT_13066 [Rhodofomes roseus]KAH9843777.1 hypothetical protein C8Q71DRAFT_13066 [Rhodofomes roseus]